jgi:hypothetical protein
MSATKRKRSDDNYEQGPPNKKLRTEDKSIAIELPFEIQQIIINFLDGRSRRTLRAVSPKWHKAIKYDNFSFFLTRSAALTSIAKLSRYNYPLSLTFTKMMVKPQSLISIISTLTNLVSLSFDGDLSTDDSAWMELTSLTKLTSLITEPDSRSQPPLALIIRLSNLQHLKLYQEDFYEVKVVDQAVVWTVGEDAETVEFPQLYNPSTLKALTINFDEETTEAVMPMIAQLTALESFAVEDTLRQIDYDWSNHPRLTYLRANTEYFPKNIHLLTHLKHLKWVDEADDTSLEKCHALSSLTSLEIFNSNIGASLPEAFQFIPASVTALCAHLSFDYDEDPITQICPIFTHLTNLQSLNVHHPVYDLLEAPFKTTLTSLVMTEMTALQFQSLSALTSLKQLYFGVRGVDYTLWNSIILKLTNLEALMPYYGLHPKFQLPPNLTYLAASVAVDFTSEYTSLWQLTSLQKLKMYNIGKDTWKMVAKLTTLESLGDVIGTDEQVQYLTALKNLTKIVFSGPRDADDVGEYEAVDYSFATALTKLQEIWYRDMHTEVIDKLYFVQTPREELNEHLPNLYRVKWKVYY